MYGLPGKCVALAFANPITEEEQRKEAKRPRRKAVLCTLCNRPRTFAQVGWNAGMRGLRNSARR